jgi:hypothetical protein
MRGAAGLRLVRWFGLLALLALVGVMGTLTAFAATATLSRTTPACKSGQKNTKAKPCTPVCKTGQKNTKAKPCAKEPKARPITITYPLTVPIRPSSPSGTTPAGTTTRPASGTNTPPPLASDDCPDGTAIPESANAGDEDADNESGFPSDGDGCL